MFQAFGAPVRIMPPLSLGARRHMHRVMGQTKEYPCEFVPPGPTGATPFGAFSVNVDPTLNCQRDARGNAVCSNGVYYPPGCPKTPPEQYFSPGIAPDEVHNGILEAKVPAPRAAGSTGSSGASSTGAGSLIAPVAIGGLIGAGLLYYFMK